mmetsp:Transcript_64678/g.107193  ORF Transcript_64678/g.107193 Transcript_64678/m.107193 type:complete len:212 (+) Transcript_64678:1091-1726(+)
MMLSKSQLPWVSSWCEVAHDGRVTEDFPLESMLLISAEYSERITEWFLSENAAGVDSSVSSRSMQPLSTKVVWHATTCLPGSLDLRYASGDSLMVWGTPDLPPSIGKSSEMPTRALCFVDACRCLSGDTVANFASRLLAVTSSVVLLLLGLGTLLLLQATSSVLIWSTCVWYCVVDVLFPKPPPNIGESFGSQACCRGSPGFRCRLLLRSP